MCWLSDSSREKSLIMSFCLFIFRPVGPNRFTKHRCTHGDFQTSNRFEINFHRNTLSSEKESKRVQSDAGFLLVPSFEIYREILLVNLSDDCKLNQSNKAKENAHGCWERASRARFGCPKEVSLAVSLRVFFWKLGFS